MAMIKQQVKASIVIIFASVQLTIFFGRIDECRDPAEALFIALLKIRHFKEQSLEQMQCLSHGGLDTAAAAAYDSPQTWMINTKHSDVLKGTRKHKDL